MAFHQTLKKQLLLYSEVRIIKNIIAFISTILTLINAFSYILKYPFMPHENSTKELNVPGIIFPTVINEVQFEIFVFQKEFNSLVLSFVQLLFLVLFCTQNQFLALLE